MAFSSIQTLGRICPPFFLNESARLPWNPICPYSMHVRVIISEGGKFGPREVYATFKTGNDAPLVEPQWHSKASNSYKDKSPVVLAVQISKVQCYSFCYSRL